MPYIAVIAIATIACAFDLRLRRIPNKLTFAGAAAGFLFHFATGGMSDGLTSVGGFLLGIALFLPLYALGGMGAGDVKLLGALGAWLGPSAAVWLALYSGIAGGVMAFCVAASTGYLKQAYTNVWTLLAYWRAVGIRPMAELTLATSEGPRLAYAAPMLAGTLLTIWLQ
jgi:prepilin peptidase CpaA